MKYNSHNKSAVIDKTIKRKLNKYLLHAMFDPSNMGIPWPVSVSTDILESASVGIPGPVIHGSARMDVPEPVSMNQFAWVSLNLSAQVLLDRSAWVYLGRLVLTFPAIMWMTEEVIS